MGKEETRKLFREKRNALTYSERMKMDDLMLIQFQRIGLPPINTVLSYWPIEHHNEPPTHVFNRYLAFNNPGLQLLYPVTDLTTNTMKAILVHVETPFAKNRIGILEPMEGEEVTAMDIDMVLVPLLAVDIRGHRLGFGKGVYDRYLQQCRADCIKTGLSYFEPIDTIGDCHRFDVPLDLCITPQAAYVF